MAWPPFRGPVGGWSVGLLENGLSLKGFFVSRGEINNKEGPACAVGAPRRRSCSRPGPAKTRYRTGERKLERGGELEGEREGEGEPNGP